MLQPVAAQTLIPFSCPPNTQAFERGVCIGEDPELTFQCDDFPPDLVLIEDDLCVLIDPVTGEFAYQEPALLVDVECNGPFPYNEETGRCETKAGRPFGAGPEE